MVSDTTPTKHSEDNHCFLFSHTLHSPLATHSAQNSLLLMPPPTSAALVLDHSIILDFRFPLKSIIDCSGVLPPPAFKNRSFKCKRWQHSGAMDRGSCEVQYQYRPIDTKAAFQISVDSSQRSSRGKNWRAAAGMQLKFARETFPAFIFCLHTPTLLRRRVIRKCAATSKTLLI